MEYYNFKDILPEVLTQEQTTMYFEKYKNGDKTARDIIISHNIRFVLFITGKILKNNVFYQDNNEIVSTAFVGLIKAVDTFTVEKEYRFSTYAERCIINEINSFFRKKKNCKEEISFESALFTMIDSEQNIFSAKEWLLQDKTINIEEQYFEKETISELYKIISTLPEQDKKIICMYFGINLEKRYKQAEIARELHLTQGQISRRITQILEEIKDECRKLQILESSSTSIKKNK